MLQEGPARIERRLSAILAADVAGYSRLMHDDEEATHVRLTALLADAVDTAIVEHGGRVVKNTGDGFLAEFPSAVEAVRAALQFQNRIHELTAGDAEDRRILFRVGINIGDVIVEPHDIFGDDVNIAARLESIADSGGICISSSAYDQVSGKLAVEFADLGEQSFKNIARPIRAYAVVREGSGAGARNAALRTPTTAPHLSMVVLPFANFGDDPEQDYFVDGVTESLTTDLSRISGSFVIARNTAFTFKGKAVNVRDVGRELNVRYVLEGSVQRSGKRLRVNVQLIDAESSKHLWAERFEKPVADFFDMQDEIVSRLAHTLDAQLIVAEARRAERSRHPDALDLVFQGFASVYRGPTTEHLSEARGFFERALAIDPRSVGALVGMASVDATMGAYVLTDDRSAHLSTAETNAIRALSLDPDRALAHRVLGTVYNMTNRPAQGIAECEQALALNRNLADAHAVIGMAKLYLGRAAETEGHILEAFRLSPRDIFAHRWMHFVGMAKIQLGADAEAAGWFRRSIEANRNSPLTHFALAAALGLQGSLDEARTAASAGLALNPGFTIRRLRASKPSDNPKFLDGRERLYEGMCLAGVPEG
jgi:TolB-like protein/class 3 adenylate cyclase/tetratricopeptide (TPR) repeat protein